MRGNGASYEGDMSFFRKLFTSKAAEPPDDRTPADRLRAEIAGLETEMAESQRALADLEATMRAVETRAMEALRAGDDLAARAALREMKSPAEKAAALTDDLKVLRAILDECHDFLNTMSEDAAAQRKSSSS